MTAKTKPCPAQRVGECEMPSGHGGDHLVRKRGAFGRSIHVWNEAHERDPSSDDASTNSWICCGAGTGAKGYRCERPQEHDDSHAQVSFSSSGTYNFVNWAGSLKGASIVTFTVNEPAAALLNRRVASPLAPVERGAQLDAFGDPEQIDDGTRCGVRQGKNGAPCILVQGHETADDVDVRTPHHSTGYRTWRDPKPKHTDSKRRAIATSKAEPMKNSKTPKAKPNKAKPKKTATAKAQTGRSAGLDSPPFVIKAAAVSPDKVRILGYRRHPITALWPLIEGDEFAELVASVKARGLDEGYEIELVKIDGETFILDGSNRGRACEAADEEPRFRQYTGKKDVATIRAYVDGRNAHRRHLTKSQLAMICAAGDRLCQGERPTGDVKTQAERGKARGLSERLQRKADFVQDHGTSKVKQAVLAGKMSVEAAEPLSRLPVADQDELADRALASPGEIKGGKVRSLVKQAEKRAVVQKINKEQVHPMPVGPFRLIVVDPPWPYDNSDQHDGSRGHMPYPPMSLADILRLGSEIDKLVHEDGTLLGLWVTNAFVHEVGRILEAWHFSPWTMITWDKGRPGIGSGPRGQTEHLYLARRGCPVHTLNEITTYHHEPPREHSRKPEGLMAKLEQHCPGPHLEMFAREQRANWAV
ncbi:MAG: hypothetical protein H0U46_07855, partial [Actinobacteria bacterium]|nr:hypothetical protein [Actinomycetota bacterium]